MSLKNLITALITTSPIPSCPSTEIISQAYDGIRSHLPDISIVITVDGMYSGHQIYGLPYEEYKQNLRNLNWPNVEIIEFEEYTHQFEMTRQAFKRNRIQTPLVLWHEHDWKLLPNIEWDKIVQTLLVDREVAHMRFAETDGVPPYDRIDPKFDRGSIVTKSGLNLLRTTEYFGCPNIARREFFEAVFRMADWGRIHFELVARGFAEKDNGREFPLSYYNPQPNRKRSQHLDGRLADGPVERTRLGIPKPPMDIDPNYEVRCNFNDAGLPINNPQKYYY